DGARDPRPRPRLPGPRGHAAHEPRTRPDPGLRPARHEGDGEGPAPPGGGGPGLRHGPGQHVPPLPRPGARAHRRLRGPARVHGLGRADHHGLRRLPGVLHGPRDGGRRDQGEGAARPGPDGADPRHRGGGRLLPLLPGRLHALHGPRDVHGGAGPAAVGHRPGVRRVHAVQRLAGVHPALDGAHAPLARALPGLARRARAGRAARLRDRPGRGPPRPARRVRRARRRGRHARHRDRRLARRREGADVRGGRLDHGGPARRPPAPPAGDRRDRRPRARRRARDRHLRLRDAHPPRAPRRRPRPGPRAPLAGGPHRGALQGRPRADHGGLPVSRVRARPLTRVPALPRPRARADRHAAAHDPQPRLRRAGDGGPARRHRGRHAPADRRRPARRRRPGVRPPGAVGRRPL
ncbi:MAG: Queuine tRNA-ribosyltransferase, partial [uncultured Solirubrobacteraceae bacterium]